MLEIFSKWIFIDLSLNYLSLQVFHLFLLLIFQGSLYLSLYKNAISNARRFHILKLSIQRQAFKIAIQFKLMPLHPNSHKKIQLSHKVLFWQFFSIIHIKEKKLVIVIKSTLTIKFRKVFHNLCQIIWK